MDKFDVHAWKLSQMLESMDEIEDPAVEEFIDEIVDGIKGYLADDVSPNDRILRSTLRTIIGSKFYQNESLSEEEIQQIFEEDDRCTRIAKRKYDVWPSAYASGAVVRCRKGEIWKNEK